jgi:hypothetical protein
VCTSFGFQEAGCLTRCRRKKVNAVSLRFRLRAAILGSILCSLDVCKADRVVCEKTRAAWMGCSVEFALVVNAHETELVALARRVQFELDQVCREQPQDRGSGHVP